MESIKKNYDTFIIDNFPLIGRFIKEKLYSHYKNHAVNDIIVPKNVYDSMTTERTLDNSIGKDDKIIVNTKMFSHTGINVREFFK